MSFGNKAIMDQLTSKCRASGLFSAVNGHEPKNAPPSNLTAAVWTQGIRPYPEGSGLSATSGVITYMIRLYTNMIAEPQDAIDPQLVAAADVILGNLTGDYDLGGTIRNIDLLAESGVGLNAQAGYVEIDGTMFRIIDITIPCVVNDVWSQVA